MNSLLGRPMMRLHKWLAARAYLFRAMATRRAPYGHPRVFYGSMRIPDEDEYAHGGMVRNQRLHKILPNTPYGFNILYLGSSTRPIHTESLFRLARQKDAKVVWNQDGVGYPGWAGDGYVRVNAALRKAVGSADHVIFQSRFCKASCERFVGEPAGNWEIIPNAVDIGHFRPRGRSDDNPPVVLLGGNQYERYRLFSGLEAFARFAETREEARLLVAGNLNWSGNKAMDKASAHALAKNLGIERQVVWLGPYSQRDAPAIYQEADVFLHTKYKDPCPSAVIEALACGLPVVHSESGGVPELVGPDAGVPVPVEETWNRQVPIDPEATGEALAKAFDERERMAKAGVRRAQERFDLRTYVDRHLSLFEGLVAA